MQKRRKFGNKNNRHRVGTTPDEMENLVVSFPYKSAIFGHIRHSPHCRLPHLECFTNQKKKKKLFFIFVVVVFNKKK